VTLIIEILAVASFIVLMSIIMSIQYAIILTALGIHKQAMEHMNVMNNPPPELGRILEEMKKRNKDEKHNKGYQ
jgi:hypothetical protein